jgi:hypothetical protein
VGLRRFATVNGCERISYPLKPHGSGAGCVVGWLRGGQVGESCFAFHLVTLVANIGGALGGVTRAGRADVSVDVCLAFCSVVVETVGVSCSRASKVLC